MTHENTLRSNLRPLSPEELTQVGGGIIIVGGRALFPFPDPWLKRQSVGNDLNTIYADKLDRVSLNPQPLPP